MKEKEENRIIFGPGGCLTRYAIQQHIDDGLCDKEKKRVLRHTKNCDLCADAVDGAGFFTSGLQFQRNLYKLDNSPWRRSLENKGRSRKLFYGLSSAAASILLLLGIYYIFQIRTELEDRGITLPNQEVAVVEEKEQFEAPGRKAELITIEDESKTLKKKAPIALEPNKQTVLEKRNEKLEDEINLEVEIFEDDSDLELEEDVIEKPMPEAEESVDFLLYDEEVNEEVARVEMPKSAAAVEEIEQMESMPELEQTARFKKKLSRKSNAKAKYVGDAYIVAEVMPMFQGGGIENFNKYLADSLRVILPDSILHQSIIVGFKIETSGRVANVRLINGTESKTLNNRIIKLVKDSPVWIPAQLGGTPVAVDQQAKVVLNGN